MRKNAKVVAKLNPLVTFILLIPLVVFGAHAYDSYRRIATGVTAQDENYYYIYTALGLYPYPKEVIDETRKYSKGDSYLKKTDALLRQNYTASLELAEKYHTTQRYLLCLLSGGAAFFLVSNLIFSATTKTELTDKKIIVKSPLLRKNDAVNINDIKTLRVETAAPLTPKRTSVSQINWRNTLIIEEKTGDITVIPLLIFPGFRKIAQRTLDQKPQIKLEFA